MIALKCPRCKASGPTSGFHARGQFCLCGWQRALSPAPASPLTADATAQARSDVACIAVAHDSTWVPCACCGFTDTEAPPNRRCYGDELPMGTTVTCEVCGATLTLVDYDYATDTGEAYGWEATPPTADTAVHIDRTISPPVVTMGGRRLS